MAREQAGNEMRDDVPLAPCPFCGATNARLVGSGVDGKAGVNADDDEWVQCGCGACGPMRTGSAAAAADWNLRQSLGKLDAAAEKKGACPIPRYVLRGMLIQRGTSLAEWARQRGVRDSTVHNALVGRRTGAKSRRLAAELLEELGL